MTANKAGKLKKTPNYQRHWEEYRLINRNFWIFAGFSVVFLFLGQLNKPIGKFLGSDLYLGVVMGIVFIIFAYYGLRLFYWRCPECSETFHKNYFYSWSFLDRCLHCDLPKYQGSIYKKS